MDKTELLLVGVGARSSISQHDCYLPVLSLHLSSNTIVASDHVRLLRVTFSSDFSLDRHVSIISATSFHWLQQLQCCRRSLDAESAATLVGLYTHSCRHTLITATLSRFMRRKCCCLWGHAPALVGLIVTCRGFSTIGTTLRQLQGIAIAIWWLVHLWHYIILRLNCKVAQKMVQQQYDFISQPLPNSFPT